MSQLRDTSILCFTDDQELFEKVRKFYSPRCREIVQAKSTYEAIVRMQNRPADAILLRMSKQHFAQKENLFHWCLMRARFRRVPWVVLGMDIEPRELAAEHQHLKFSESVDDFEQVSKFLEGMLALSRGDSRSAVDVNLINPLVSALVQVMDRMAGMKLERGQVHIKGQSDSAFKGDITGLIGLNSERNSGSFSITFPEPVIVAAYRKIFGVEAAGVNDDIKNWVLELTNLIYGIAQKELHSTGHAMQQAVPSVIAGPGHVVRHSVDGRCIAIPFSTEYGPMVFECVIGTPR
jgi:chemotaxis protein CheX